MPQDAALTLTFGRNIFKNAREPSSGARRFKLCLCVLARHPD